MNQNKHHHIIGYIKSYPIKSIYICATIYVLLYIALFGARESTDTVSYVNAFDSLESLKLDLFRTPLYPLILGLFGEIFGNNNMFIATVIFQSILFIVSIKYLFLVAKNLTNSNNLSYIIVISYCFIPSITKWHITLLTESLALSLSVFLLYSMVQLYNDKKSNRWGTLYFVFLILLLMLRPSFLYLIPAGLIFSFILFWKDVKKGILALVAIILCGSFVYGYCRIIDSEYGVFTMSTVSINNNEKTLADMGVKEFSISKIDSNDGTKTLNDTYNSKENYENVFPNSPNGSSDYGYSVRHNKINEYLKNNPTMLVKIFMSHLMSACDMRLLFGNIPTIFTFSSLYYLFLIYSIFIFYVYRKQHKFPGLSFSVFIIGLGNCFTVLIGAPGEWSRLIVPSLPIYMIMFFQILNCFKIKFKPKIFLE